MENYNRASAIKQTARIQNVIEDNLLHSQTSRQIQQDIHAALHEDDEEFYSDDEDERIDTSEEEAEESDASGNEEEGSHNSESDTIVAISDTPAITSGKCVLIFLNIQIFMRN
jgi:cobalamin biosynthesis protein CobT